MEDDIMEYIPAKYRIGAHNDAEWEKFQQRVKDMDAKMGHQIGVNLFTVELTFRIE